MRRPLLMDKREKAVWGVLNESEQKAWWRWWIASVVGLLLFLVAGTWLVAFYPSSERLGSGLAVLMSAGAGIVAYSINKVKDLLTDRILRRSFYQE